jgi:hypothetical protein
MRKEYEDRVKGAVLTMRGHESRGNANRFWAHSEEA